MNKISLGEEYVDLTEISGVSVQLLYATKNNFTGENLYSNSLSSAYLHADAAKKLRDASDILQSMRPDWSLLIFDALRPRSVQVRMWNHVKGTPQEIYVANPDRGSMHNFGLAVDLTLKDEFGLEVDMGTPFDSFQELAQPRHEEKFLETGDLTLKQVENRRLLRTVMVEAGFFSIPHEWWHFNAIDFATAKTNYRMIE